MGHEDVRRAVVAHLKTSVPVMLRQIRSDNVPILPRAYLAQDNMPDDDRLPAVCVASTDLLELRFTTTNKPGPVRALYSVEVACFVVATTHKADEQASIGRDRLLQAIRHSILAPRVVGMTIDRETYRERTDPAVVDTKGRPLAQGVASFNVSADEVLPGPDGVPADPHYTIAHLP